MPRITISRDPVGPSVAVDVLQPFGQTEVIYT